MRAHVVPMTTPATGTEAVALGPAMSRRHVRREVVRLGGLAVAAFVVVALLPSLGRIRDRFVHAAPGWIVVGCALEVASALSYVLAFRGVFCKRMTWATSYKIAMAEQGASSILPVGGAGGLALGAWALRRGGIPADEIARKTVAFFLLTSAPNVGTLIFLGVALATDALPGHVSVVLALVPAAAGCGAIAATLGLGRLSGRIEACSIASSEPSRATRLVPACRAVTDGVQEALGVLRQRDPLLFAGLVGYMSFDILVLWASFRALGSAPQLAIVAIAYLIGQLGNLIPVPGGIGGVELGLIGALVLYGLPALTATAAVLLYRVFELCIPVGLGVPAFVQLQRLLRSEGDAIDVCHAAGVADTSSCGSEVAKHAP
jgi:uncharacterized membrane protein YbhN (UPF0104 family)